MIKIIVLLVLLAGCSKKTYKPETEIDQKLYRECMRATPPAAFDGGSNTQHIIWACERNSKIRSDE